MSSHQPFHQLQPICLKVGESEAPTLSLKICVSLKSFGQIVLKLWEYGQFAKDSSHSTTGPSPECIYLDSLRRQNDNILINESY